MNEIQHRTKRIPEVTPLPNLVQIQISSYDWFLKTGLKELLASFSPITDFPGNLTLELLDYYLGEPKYSLEECRFRDMTTYEKPMYVRVRLSSPGKEVIESDVYLGNLPIMTEKGTFVINGAERVVVSQLARSSGVYFKDTLDLMGKTLFFSTVIPSPGAWVDVETDSAKVISVKIAQTKKFPLTTFLRALNEFEAACPENDVLRPEDAAGRVLSVSVANEDGEILANEGDVITDETAAALSEAGVELVTVTGRTHPCGTNAEILSVFCEKEVLNALTAESMVGRRPVEDIADAKGKVITKAGERITEDSAKKILKLKNLSSVEVFERNAYLDATLDEDTTGNTEEALIDIYKRIRPGDPATPESARTLLASYFFDIRRYDLGRVSRYKLNKKLGLSLSEEVRCITREDVIKIIRYIIGLSEDGKIVTHFNYTNLAKRIPDLEKAVKAEEKKASAEDKAPGGKVYSYRRRLNFLKDVRRGDIFSVDALKETRELLKLIDGGSKLISDDPDNRYPETALRLVDCRTDDIDDLENKRIRSVGELLIEQLRMGFLRMEKVAKERMTSIDADNLFPQVILSVKPVTASIKSFFGSSQLSQFMDQTNPLAELTHKRRLSALGPGGLSRQSAKLEVRDVHHSHYGRICPIETPEGPNIGLIGSMAIHAEIDKYGFLRSPYRVVRDGVVTDEIVYLSASEESQEYIAPAQTPINPTTGAFETPIVKVRHAGGYPDVKSEKVTYVDISPKQIMSVAASLIPFLENDDANRALMGSNMQRQAVPLIRGEAPIVRTGVERRAAADSGAVVLAKRSGTVTYVSATEIRIKAKDGTVDTYRLLNMLRSNQATCITQRPLVDVGKRVREGQVIADGPCTGNGELALGKNVLVAFMPWNGYNYEDAILLSRRLVKDDVYTSVHIEKYETEARDTKLGPEEITRDIPNVGENMLKDLDENGIIRIGAKVAPEDILVGKVAPKGQGELTAEDKLIIAIFGKKAEETRDVSLRVPHGESGTIVDVKVFSRYKYKCEKCGRIIEYGKKPDEVVCECGHVGSATREISDDLPSGVNRLVRVYIAQKRKIMQGDKMAGRHGNKGVISRILPEEDMPFLPDGTPVDIVLNPLGVPSRMNIGQILETHQGWAGRHLNCMFKNPIFEGATETEILADVATATWKLRIDVLRKYLKELNVLSPVPTEEEVEDVIKDILAEIVETEGDKVTEVPQPIIDLYNKVVADAKEYIKSMDAAQLETLSIALNGPEAVADPEAFRAVMDENSEGAEIAESEDEEFTPKPLPGEGKKAPKDYDYDVLVARIEANAQNRMGYNEKTCKCRLFDGRTGRQFDQDVTVGVVYMLKLHHLVEDKIHARSTGPYSLVTQQPLGGKAQFGGQRFGEMEVWALEAYGAAYTLQEILTIKSDDVNGRVKTYESIVKGENILEPGVPESFKILINELRSLCLNVSVEDIEGNKIDLKDSDDVYSGGRFRKPDNVKEDRVKEVIND
ncbi:MAG: DNA-directed RNA polymerase subunit beta [Abditibacteriota bacterium]|nr:DNA-directed RNA polymerase subunit beta [Abditibacteriota bacterium]